MRLFFDSISIAQNEGVVILEVGESLADGTIQHHLSMQQLQFIQHTRWLIVRHAWLKQMIWMLLTRASQKLWRPCSIRLTCGDAWCSIGQFISISNSARDFHTRHEGNGWVVDIGVRNDQQWTGNRWKHAHINTAACFQRLVLSVSFELNSQVCWILVSNLIPYVEPYAVATTQVDCSTVFESNYRTWRTSMLKRAVRQTIASTF